MDYLHDLPQNAVELVKAYLLSLQKELCQTLQNLDGKGQFLQDEWQRPLGGSGLTCVMRDGAVHALDGEVGLPATRALRDFSTEGRPFQRIVQQGQRVRLRLQCKGRRRAHRQRTVRCNGAGLRSGHGLSLTQSVCEVG